MCGRNDMPNLDNDDNHDMVDVNGAPSAMDEDGELDGGEYGGI